MTEVTPPLENTRFSPFFDFTVLRPPGNSPRGFVTREKLAVPAAQKQPPGWVAVFCLQKNLLQLDLAAGLFDLLLHSLGIVLGQAFLQGVGHALNGSLGLGQA